MSDTDTPRYGALFLGGGPAAIGPLVCALQQGRLEALLDRRIAIVERGPALGRGTIGKYVINSDTVGGTLLECLSPATEPVLGPVFQSAAARLIAERRSAAVPLKVVGEYIAEVGAALQTAIDCHPASAFLPQTSALAVQAQPDGSFKTLVEQGGTQRQIYSERVVLAMGAAQRRGQVLNEQVSGVALRDYDAKIVLTDRLLTEAGVAEASRRLLDAPRPRVVIIGGSHSAFSAAWTLLNQLPDVAFAAGEIALLHRGKLKIFYPTRTAALAAGYTEFDDDDFCPVTNRLFRLGGFRLDSRELLLRLRGMTPGETEERVQLVELAGMSAAEVRQLLDAAALVVPAFGYRPNTVPIYAADGAEIPLLANQTGALPLVDTAGRVLAADGTPIAGVLGIGLASGFKLTGKLGGEPSFTGQTNGLWLYQNGVGELILDQII